MFPYIYIVNGASTLEIIFGACYQTNRYLRRKPNSFCLMNDSKFYHGVLNHFHKF